MQQGLRGHCQSEPRLVVTLRIFFASVPDCVLLLTELYRRRRDATPHERRAVLRRGTDTTIAALLSYGRLLRLARRSIA